MALCREAARRADVFYLQWVWSDQGEFSYQQAGLDMYQEPEEFVDWMLSLDVNESAFDVGMQVRRMFPLVGVVIHDR